jgi:predicted GNAT family acetyltransferase
MKSIIENNELKLFNEENIQVGNIVFEIDSKEKTLTILHTIVEPNFRGQGIAGLLTEEIIKYVKTVGFKIIPVCSYAISFFEKHPEYKSILK